MTGKLYGIGVGPGDPEYMTLKAVRIIEECDVIAVPGRKVEESVAFQIAAGACSRLSDKTCIAIPMPMTKDREILEQSHREGAKLLALHLDQNKKVAFLTLGDPTVYSTYWYLHHILEKEGYETEIVSGIPSFCAVAAKLNTALVESAEPLHIYPASYAIEEAMQLSGTKVFMKSGKKLGDVKEQLLRSDAQVRMIENCGMPNEKIYNSANEIPETGSYYTLIIAKEKS